jgi:hypothetical protein
MNHKLKSLKSIEIEIKVEIEIFSCASKASIAGIISASDDLGRID